METITEKGEGQVEAKPKIAVRPLQVKIEESLLDRVQLLATRRKTLERRQIHARDIVVEALEQYLPKAEREADELAAARAKS